MEIIPTTRVWLRMEALELQTGYLIQNCLQSGPGSLEAKWGRQRQSRDRNTTVAGGLQEEVVLPNQGRVIR